VARRRPSLGFRLTGALIAVAAFLLLGEGYARFLDPVVPGWQGRDPGDVIMVGHPTRLWGMGTGIRNNAGAKATINDLGLRGEKPRVPRPRGRERVMITGDSSFFGHGVADDETPAVLLGRALRGAGIDADTVNAAVPGYSTEQTRLLLDEVGWSLEPSLVVVANVWSDYNFDHFKDEDLLRTQRVYGGSLLGQSAFFRLVGGWVDRARGGAGAHLVTWTRHSEFPAEGVRRVPPARFAENLDAIVRAAREHGAGVVFLQPTNRDMARGDLSGEEVRAPYFGAQGAVATWHGTVVVHTLDAFQAAAGSAGPDALFLDDLHPSAAGNAVVADAIVASLRAARWPTERLLGRAEAFDASGVVDTAPDSLGASPGAMSPQVNLFPGGASGLAASSGGARTGGPGGGADAQAGTAGSTNGTVAAGGPEAVPVDVAPAWTVTGTVDAPPEPVEVTVRSLTDEKLAAVVLRGERSFSLAVPAGHPAVRVEAMGADGRVVAETHSGDAPLVLVLGRR